MFKIWLEINESSTTRFRQTAVKNGWRHEPRRGWTGFNSNAIKIGDTYYDTLKHPNGVKVAFSELDIYKYKNLIHFAGGDEVSPNRITLMAIISPGENRGKGLASEALKSLNKIADSLDMVVVGQPVQMVQFEDEKALTTQQLISWYKKHGWVQRDEGDDSILEYMPNKQFKNP